MGFSFKEHMKRGTHLLATGPVKGMFVGEFRLLLDRSSAGDEDNFTASTVT